MAALAIPIIVLGSLYILSEQEKKEYFTSEALEQQDEQFENKNKKNMQNMQNMKNMQNMQNMQNNNLREGYSNYNTEKLEDFNKQSSYATNSYNNSNQHTDKFFVSDNKNMLTNEIETNKINLMSGQQMNVNQFKHNNMQPFFGAKIRGLTNDLNNTESIMDSKQGNGSQLFSKSEQAPLFKPDENVNLNHGTANNSDFFQSRMNESMKMSNVTLWEPQRVGPGLNLGYGSQNEKGYNTGGTEGSHGFNSGMMSRENWMPKNVDELRVDTNTKQSFDLFGHEGPANSSIKMQGSNNKIGKIEKHLPEKFYNSGPQRWFTTTGAEKNPPIRSTQVLPMENRIDTSREYYGAGNYTHAQTTYTNPEFEESKKQSLGGLPISNASATGKNFAGENDYAKQGYNLLNNNRTTDKNSLEMGGVYGMAKAAVAPILDIFKPTRKENVVGNLRQSGNVNGLSYTGHLFNQHDKTKTTNREMTTDKIDMNYVNVERQTYNGDAYRVTQCQPSENQRDSTNQEYIGGRSAQGTGLRPYNAAYAQENNVNKTYELRANQGNMNLFNNHNNTSINRDENIMKNNRNNVPNGGPNMIPSSEFMGEIQGMQTYDNNFNNARMDKSLLNAFKENPYTKSLNSVA